MLSFAETLLPGARFLRPVLFSGALWLLFAWLILQDEIPAADDAEGFAKQAYELIQYFGPFGAAVVILLAAFIVGTLTAPIAALPALAVREVRSWLEDRRAWYEHVRDSRNEFLTMIAQSEAELAQLETSQSADDSSVGEREKIQEMITLTNTRLKAFKLRSWIWRTKELRGYIGHGSAQVDLSRERAFLNRARDDGATQYFESVNFTDYPSVRMVVRSIDAGLVSQLRSELTPDPLDLVHALDEKLFLDLDRERSERDVRIAVSLPFVAIGTYFAVAWTPWASIAAAISLVLFVQNTAASANEANRVLTQLDARSLVPPSARAARASGRDHAWGYIRNSEKRRGPGVDPPSS